MKVAFITTVDHNVGDDFIREGVKYLLKNYFSTKNIHFTNVHKHSPITSRYGFEKVRSLRQSERWDKRIPLWLTKDRILESDLVVQSGAPVYWCHKGLSTCVSHNEWYKPLIKERYLKKDDSSLINIAAGSCQAFFSDGGEFLEDQAVCEYIREFAELSDVTTVRDKLAQNVLKMLGYDVPLIPCASVFAIDELQIKSQSSKYVIVNYMSGGGHFKFNQNIDSRKWESTFREFYEKLKTHEDVVFSCHNKKEIEEAKLIDPHANIFFSNSYQDYLKLYAKTKFAFVNRIHAAYPIASFGKQAIIIGADTRAKMALEIDLPYTFVNDINVEVLLQIYDQFRSSEKEYSDKLQKIKRRALDNYMSAFSKIE